MHKWHNWEKAPCRFLLVQARQQYLCKALRVDDALILYDCIQVEPGKPGAEVSKKKTLSQRKNLPIKEGEGEDVKVVRS